jgi:hypothetical protein
MKKQRKLGFLALIGLVAVASIFTVCKASGAGTGTGEQMDWKVTFDTAGGVPEPETNPVTVAHGETIGRMPSPEPAKDGFIFGGWFLENTPFYPATRITRDITLRANWISPAEENRFHVIFDGDGGDGNTGYTSGAKITIGSGTEHPVVIAKGGTSTDSAGTEADSACGIGSGGSSVASVIEIEIQSGFVAAQSNRPNGRGIGINPVSNSGSSYVKISGGSVYAANTDTGANLINPATKADSATAVYPLYASNLAGNKTISVANPAYSANTIGKSAARFLTTGLWTPAGTDQFPEAPLSGTDIFPHTLSGTLWLPAGEYTGITANGEGSYHADVTDAIAPYTPDGPNRLLQ